MMERHLIPIAIGAALLAITTFLAEAVAQTLSPITIFAGTVTVPSREGTTQSINITVQSWRMSGPKSTTHEIPLAGFYVAHLLGGNIFTTIDGQISKRKPGDYWVVKIGTTMQVNVLGNLAVLETTVLGKQ
jgi:hypothetical protein